MSEIVTMNIEGVPARVIQTGDGTLAHVTECPDFERLTANTMQRYEEARADYFLTDPDSEAIITAAQKWEKAAKAMISRAAALFNLYQDDQESRRRALEIIERCARESMIREQMIFDYTERKKSEVPENKTMQDQLDSLSMDFMRHTNRAVSTGLLYHSKYTKSEAGDPTELQAEKDASAIAAEIRNAVPADRAYCPARPFPPERIPEDELVPDVPEPFQRFKEIPVREKIYDRDLEEFVLPKGYISEDGLIDDESVVWHREDRTVTMKYRGGEPVTWPYWKPENAADVPEPGCWYEEYAMRIYDQWAEKHRLKPNI